MVAFAKEAVTDADEQNELKGPRNTDRSADQVAMDEYVGTIVQSWEAAGKPGPEKSPTSDKLIVSPDDVSELKSQIRRACTLHKVAPAYFKDVKRPDGRVSVKFTVMAPPPRKPRNANGAASADGNAAPAGDAAPSSASAGDQPGAPAPATPRPGTSGSARPGGKR